MNKNLKKREKIIETIKNFIEFANEGTDGILNTSVLAELITEDMIETKTIRKSEYSRYEKYIEKIADLMLEKNILTTKKSEYDGCTILAINKQKNNKLAIT